MFKNIFIFFSLFILSLATFSRQSFAESFPVKGVIKARVEFWKKVYTQISSTQAFIHDSEDQTIIYKKVNLPKTKRERVRFIKKNKREIKRILLAIAKNRTEKLNSYGKKILKLVGNKTKKELYQMMKDIRFQYGMSDRYYKGLIRSYRFLDFIKKTFKQMGIPEELSYLPHVESSFNYKAYSKVGAAGIWQFMRSTGRLYGLKINYIIDERRDPIKATKAAARLLRDNYRRLNSWPLALTAYNHGANSIARAIKKLQTTDIHIIVDKYNGRRFGFASKNFYATFMATVEISKNPEKYFKSFQMPKKYQYSTLKLNKALTIEQIQKGLSLSEETIRAYNYEIRPKAFRYPLYLPKGFKLKLPPLSKMKLARYQKSLEDIKLSPEAGHTQHLHIISRGETLFDISMLYKINMHKIIAFNDISNPSRIFPGMKLKIPGKDSIIQTQKIKEDNKIRQNITITQGNTKDKEIYKVEKEVMPINFPNFLGAKKKKISASQLTAPPFTKPPLINLVSYNLEIKKIKKNLYRISIEPEETLGHYADWGLIPISSIRHKNSMGPRSNINLGVRLLLPLKDENLQRFKEQRNEYHLSIQEDFYDNFRFLSTKAYKVKASESIHSITQKFDIPIWILRKYQKDERLNLNLQKGEILQIPKFEEVNEASTQLPTKENQDEDEDQDEDENSN